MFFLSGGDQCLRNPCGDNAKCRDIQGGFKCTCVPGCTGDPYRGCLCQGPQTDFCRDKHCGVNAACRVVNNREPECYCPNNYPSGNPYIECKEFQTLITKFFNRNDSEVGKLICIMQVFDQVHVANIIHF